MDTAKEEIVEVEMNDSQLDCLDSEAKENFFIGGLGSGKTFTLATFIYDNCRVVGSLGFLGSPTKESMKEATFPQIQDALEILGISPDLHYVVNIRPPESWGVRPFSRLSSKGVVTFRWGSYLILDGLENYNSRRGTQYDYIAVDEFRDIKPKARTVLVGRLRGKTFMSKGLKQKICYVTTPPDNPLFLKTLFDLNDKEIHFTFASSFENEHNLPDGYIQSMLNIYDDETIDREVYGRLTTVVNNQFAYAFNEKRNTGPCVIRPRDDIYLSFDFNVDPMTCIVAQTDRLTYLNIIKEFRIPNSDTYAMCDAINKEYEHLDPYYIITGDASGNARQSATKGGLSHYQIIAAELDIYSRQIKTPRSNASISNSRILLNSMLKNFPEFRIDAKQCPHLIKDLMFVETELGRNGKIGIKKTGILMAGMDSASMTHLLDCLRYILQTYFFGFVKIKRGQK